MADTLLERTYVVKLAIESAKGTFEATTLDLLCFDAKCDPVTDHEERVGDGKYEAGNNVGVFGPEKGKCSLRTELLGNGSGAIDPALSALLQACNFKLTSSTYTAPTSLYTNKKTVSISVYHSGKLKTMSGCSGTCVLTGEAGKAASLQFELTGNWLGETDAALASSWSPSAQKPMKLTALSAGGAVRKVSRYELDTGIAVEPQPDPAGTGGVAAYIAHTDDAMVTIDPETQLVATWDVDGLRKAKTAIAIAATFSNGTDKLIITTAACEILENPNAARNRILTSQVKCRALMTSGDDNISMVASAA